MKQSKKKKISRASRKGNAGNQGASCEIVDAKGQRNIRNLATAFNSMSLEEGTSAFKEAKGDPNVAAEILANGVESAASEDQSTTCSSSGGNNKLASGSSSLESEGFGDANDFVQIGFNRKSKPKLKKVIAAAGTVSTVLGKDYVRSIPNKSSSKLKGCNEEKWNKEEAEQFLCSMLGEECELSLAVVSDVLCECGYNLEKALDVLLDLSASSAEQTNGCYEFAVEEDAQYHFESNDSQTERTSDSTSHSSEIEQKDSPWVTGNLSSFYRNYSKVSGSSEHHLLTEPLESKLPHTVLESLFNMPTPKNAEREPNTKNWRNLVQKMTSLGQRFEPGDSKQEQLIHAKGGEYQVLRATAMQHRESMKSYYQKAATAFTDGEKGHAAYLSEQGKLYSKMAREADEKASQDIFTARNKRIENVITIDLHGQHVKQAMRLLKIHLLFGAYVRTVLSFKVITGCGSHGVGKSKLKNSVIDLLKKEGIEWSELNQGMLFIRLGEQRDFGFQDSGNESE